jgi:6-phosphogluconolactonase
MNIKEMGKGTRVACLGGVLAILGVVAASGARPISYSAPAPATKGLIFTMTNQARNNNVVYAYTRHTDGTLTFLNSYSNHGSGSGSDLNSQNALLLVGNRNLLYVTNPMSGSISVFSVSPAGLSFVGSTPSGGRMPTSLTTFGNYVYALNYVSQDITGFTIGSNGVLTAIPDAIGALSPVPDSAPAEVEFTPSGTQIVATQRKANLIDVFPVNSDGTVGTAVVDNSFGQGPFGFAFDANAFLDVAEFGHPLNGLSSYKVQSDGALTVLSGSVKDSGIEISHIVEVNNSTLAMPIVYVSNAVSDSISSYTVNPDGTVSLLNPAVVQFAKGLKLLDMALDTSSSHLYVLTQKNGTITGFTINPDASLTQITSVSGLPTSGTWGLAGY